MHYLNDLKHKFSFYFIKLISGYQSKLIVCFLFCSVIPLLLIGIISYNTSYNIAENKIMDAVVLSTNQSVQMINNRIEQLENVADSVNYYLYTLNNNSPNELSTWMDNYSLVRNSISSLCTTFKIYYIAAFVKTDLNISNEGLMFNNFDVLKKYGLKKEDLLNLGIHSKWLFKANATFPYIISKTYKKIPSIFCYRSFGLTVDSLDYAYFVCIRSEELSDILNKAYKNIDINCYLLQNDGTIIAHSNGDGIGTNIGKEKLNIIEEHSSNKAFSYKSNLMLVHPVKNNWYLIAEVPKHYISKNTNILVNIILITLLLVIIAVIISTIYISKGLTKRLKLLAKVMASTEINGHTVKSKQLGQMLNKNKKYYDEVDQLSITFKKMLKTLDKNFNEILDLSLQEERLKYQLLHSQINPHFLYNILGSIQTCQSIGRLDTANKTITDLAKFYRHILHKPNDLITIKEELEIASLYMELEQQCRNGNLSWDVQSEDGIENFLIQKFTLQPILENCIHHGIKDSTTCMHINISLSYNDDTITIVISDNGIGIEPLQLNDIRKTLRDRIITFDKHYGIGNLNARLSSTLHWLGHIGIDSKKGHGTTVTIEIEQLLNE